MLHNANSHQITRVPGEGRAFEDSLFSLNHSKRSLGDIPQEHFKTSSQRRHQPIFLNFFPGLCYNGKSQRLCGPVYLMLPSSKSPSRRRAVPFLAASRSISAWGETTASGPSAPAQLPGEGGPPGSRSLRPKAQSRALPCRSHGSCPPSVPFSLRVLPHLNFGACWPRRVRCRPGLCSPRLVPASHTRPAPATPPAAAEARAGARRRAPASPAGSAGPSATSASPSPPGARVSAAAHPGELPASSPQRSTSCSR